MKLNTDRNRFCFALALLALVSISLRAGAKEDEVSREIDPTIPADTMSERLKNLVADAQKLRALAVGVKGEGVALIGEKMVRAGSVINDEVDGVKVAVNIESVTAKGVELAGGILLPGSFAPLALPDEADKEFLNYLEAEDVELRIILRMISDQTGVNISSSESCAKTKVSIFLRNVNAEAAVEEICRSAGLWFRRERSSGVIRVMTLKEYSDNLNTFREEATEIFTLLYPNVIEVAGAIYGLYPDRTFLSLGEEEFDEDAEYDLARRLRRFRVIEDNGGSQFMGMSSPRTSSGSSGSGGGTFSFSRGALTSRISQWDEVRRRSRGKQNGLYLNDNVGFDDARLLEEAYRQGDTNFIERIKNQATSSTANIFVSISRRNNNLIVRTSDVKVMDEIRALVKKLDVPTPMVLMEVKVLELDVTDDFTAEFSYGFNRGGSAYNATGANGRRADNLLAGFPGFDPILNNSPLSGAMSFQVVSDKVAARIQLLEKDGKLKTLATPTLLTANNEVSRIFSGYEYPIVTGWTKGETIVTETSVVKTEASADVEIKDIGTMLLITPNINADKTVTLRLLQENSTVSPDKAQIPVDGDSKDMREVEYVESRSLAGTFVAKDNMLVLAGGLIKETEEEVYTRTPILGSIPLIGWLFRGTEKVKRRTEMIVLIKPHVISTPIEGGKISQELLDALSAHPAADGSSSMGTHKELKDHTVGDDIENIVK